MRIIIDDWKQYEQETTGRQEKEWLLNNDNLYLFKQVTKREDGTSVLNDVSECIASDVAELMNISCARYYLCRRNNVDGVITPSFLKNKLGEKKKEEFISGVNLIYMIDPDFKNMALENPKNHDLYTVSLVLKAVEEYGLIKPALEMIVYDLLIGNYDRNPSNWGIIKNYETNEIRFAPLFDNATSLAIPVSDKRINRDIILVDNKPKIIDIDHLKVVVHQHIISKIVLEKHFQRDGQKKWYKTREEQNLPNQAYNFRIMEYQPLFEYLTTFYSKEIEDIINKMGTYIKEENIDFILSKYTDELDAPRMEFAKTIVMERAEWMTSYYQQEKQSYEGRLFV